MKNRNTFFLPILLLITCVCQAQQSNYSFTRISTDEGLSQGHVNAILKEKKGFIWFATDGGLNRYDGYAFTIYKHDPQKPNSISNNIVMDIAEDFDSNLWIATNDGLDKFDRKKEIFIHHRSGDAMAVTDLLIDSKNRIWLGTKNGFYFFDKTTESFTGYHQVGNNSNSLSNNFVHKLAEDNEGNIWIATRDGLNKFDPSSKNFTVYKNNNADKSSIGGNLLKTVYKDLQGNIWVGTVGNGISKFVSRENRFINFRHQSGNDNSLIHNDILSFAEDKDGQLWIGTENGGISIFNQTNQRFAHLQNDPSDASSLSNNSVYSLYKDNEGNMWVGTWSNGANLLPAIKRKFAYYKQIAGNPNSLSNSIVLSIAGDSNGQIWLGTDGGGLNCFNPLTQKFTHFKHSATNKNSVSSDYVITVIEVEKNVLALGYHRAGLDLLNTVTGLFTHYPLIATDDNKSSYELSCNTLFKDSNGTIWIGTWGGGTFLLNKKDNELSILKNDPTDKNSLCNNFINCFWEDTEGNIWVGTSGGADKYDPIKKTFTHYTHNFSDPASISDNEIMSVYQTKNGSIWIATASGLDLYDKKTDNFIHYSNNERLHCESILSIEEDRNGILWLSSDNGIIRYDPIKKSSRNFDKSDGLQDKEFKPKCSFQLKDGTMFFGGPNGFNIFHPENIPENKNIPPVYITGMHIFNKPQHPGEVGSFISSAFAETNEIKLSHKENMITFEFAALNYILPEKNLYAYKLEGLEKDWNYMGTKRNASYTNLEPGTYTFRVKASNNDSIWNEEGASLTIIITPPYWQTWWFRAIIGIGITGWLIGFYLFRMNNVGKQKQLLEQKVREQTRLLLLMNEEERKLRMQADETNKQLISKNSELQQFAYIASHDLQEPLRTTSGFVQLLQTKYRGKLDIDADKYLAFIAGSAERMKMLINDLLDFSKLGNNAKLTEIDCNELLQILQADLGAVIASTSATISVGEMPIIKGYATEIKLLFQNLIVNAIKFRKKNTAPLIAVSFEPIETGWQFCVSDNGIGIDKKYHDKIFRIFQRLHNKDEFEGSGIGLSHCAKIVDMHKGKIWILSEPEKGAAFYFTIQNPSE